MEQEQTEKKEQTEIHIQAQIQAVLIAQDIKSVTEPAEQKQKQQHQATQKYHEHHEHQDQEPFIKDSNRSHLFRDSGKCQSISYNPLTLGNPRST